MHQTDQWIIHKWKELEIERRTRLLYTSESDCITSSMIVSHICEHRAMDNSLNWLTSGRVVFSRTVFLITFTGIKDLFSMDFFKCSVKDVEDISLLQWPTAQRTKLSPTLCRWVANDVCISSARGCNALLNDMFSWAVSTLAWSLPSSCQKSQ